MTHTRANTSGPARTWFAAILPLLLVACTSVDAPTDAAAKPPPLYYPGVGNPFIVQQISAVSLQYGSSEADAGNSGTSLNINWQTSQDQQVLLTGNVTFTFTAPLGVSTRILRLIQDGAGSHTVTWPGTVKWPGGTAPTLSTAAGAVDVVSCYWNSATYDCQAALNFQ
jgi:hypothetical protein